MGTRYVPIGEGGPPPRKSGFISFLGKLEWIRDAELENMVPFDTEKLRTPHVVYIFMQGAGLATGLHATGVALFFSIAFLSYLLPVLKFLLLMVEIYFIAIKVGIPIWLIHRFVTFQRGLSTEMIKHYTFGFTFVSFLTDIVSLGLGFVLLIVVNALYGTGIEIYDEKVYPFLTIFLNIKMLASILINLLSDPIPLIYFWVFRRRRKENFPRWIPLDTIPEPDAR